MPLHEISTVGELRELVEGWREAGDSVALVPTMGNLHKGHISLVELAAQHAEHVIVSVFVNPTQFGPQEDFAEYPRTPEMDARRLARAQVDVLFAPDVEAMYPGGVESACQVIVPGLSDELCGADRAGHFVGVTSVVARLFNICAPTAAVFGQKDYQQLVILRRMVRDLHMPVQIIAGPIVRAENGLALSSRNGFLSAAEQDQAAAIYAALRATRVALEAGQTDYGALESAAAAQIAAAGLHPDYVAIRRAGDLRPPRGDSKRLAVLAAARCGKVRLIDNVLVDLQP
ncbi:MAG: pantoate--beta-alanine ligase [Gammaproteobacteria bacterium]|jgi:pantoate--beta-alanine ligase|nr:pantoate--beta-alanine ligase [Gammaproteobacteria bacterium]